MTATEVPTAALYPFTPKSFRQPHGNAQSYLDEGTGDPVVMVHGNPTWSAYFRNVVLALRDRYRCVARTTSAAAVPTSRRSPSTTSA